jgi:hypothetical protein
MAESGPPATPQDTVEARIATILSNENKRLFPYQRETLYDYA